MDQRARQGELLFHAAGEAVGKTVVEGCETDQFEQLAAPLAPFGDAVHQGKELDVLVHREVAVKGESLGEVSEPGVEGVSCSCQQSSPNAVAAPLSARCSPPRTRRLRSCRRRRGRSDPPPHPLADGEGHAADCLEAAVADDELAGFEKGEERSQPLSVEKGVGRHAGFEDPLVVLQLRP